MEQLNEAAEATDNMGSHGGDMTKIEFLESYAKGRLLQIARKTRIVSINKYAGRPILKGPAAYDTIYSMLSNDSPCMIGRFGASECCVLVRRIEIQYGMHRHYGRHMDTFCFNAGYFPHTEEAVNQYCDYIRNVYWEADAIAPMKSLGEEYVIKKYCNNPTLLDLEALDPYPLHPWIQALEGKRVLVVHPYEHTIRNQFERIDRVYPDRGMPHFELQTVKAVQSIGGGCAEYSNWFDALHDMEAQIIGHDFDIALIGCGAYGFPLAVSVKRMGKKAVHVGGCLQLLFGIKGRRWTSQANYQRLINQYWVSPTAEETPAVAMQIENGCYWQ